MRYSRAEQALALQEEVSRADADYQRLRNAYLEIARTQPGHEVALAMVGADMDRAYARLQTLRGLTGSALGSDGAVEARREAQRLAQAQEPEGS